MPKMIKFNILDKIREAQKLAIKENMKVNAIQLSKDFVKIPEFTTHSTEYGCVSVTYPMICGLRCYIDNDNELPEEYAFALFDDSKGCSQWLPVKAIDGSIHSYECSICGSKHLMSHNYCPNCGAKMEVSNK